MLKKLNTISTVLFVLAIFIANFAVFYAMYDTTWLHATLEWKHWTRDGEIICGIVPITFVFWSVVHLINFIKEAKARKSN